jgi:hypothetical protein
MQTRASFKSQIVISTRIGNTLYTHCTWTAKHDMHDMTGCCSAIFKSSSIALVIYLQFKIFQNTQQKLHCISIFLNKTLKTSLGFHDHVICPVWTISIANFLFLRKEYPGFRFRKLHDPDIFQRHETFHLGVTVTTDYVRNLWISQLLEFQFPRSEHTL